MKKSSTRMKYRTEYGANHKFDYKDPLMLSRFVAEGGKIAPARISKLSQAHQRHLAKAVKVARSMALLPSGAFAFDEHHRAEGISPVPFEY